MWDVWEAFSDKVAFEQKHEGREGRCRAEIPRSGNRKCRGPEGGVCLMKEHHITKAKCTKHGEE